MHYQIETMTDHFSPAQILELRREAKREGKQFSSRRKADGQVEVEIKRYLDPNAIHRIRYID